MKKTIIDITILLIVGHLLSESHSIIAYFYPALNTKSVDLFLCPSYHMNMILAWYIKMTSDDLLYLLTFYVLAKAAYSYSIRLFAVSVVFFFYHAVDMFMFWWNFKQDHYFYWFLLLSVIATVVLTIFPFTAEKFAKVKSLF